MNTNQCHDPTGLCTDLQSSISQIRVPQGASFQCLAFCLTGALHGVYRNVRWRSIQGFGPRFLAVSDLFVPVPGPFVAVPGPFVVVPGLSVAVPGPLVAVLGLCDGLRKA